MLYVILGFFDFKKFDVGEKNPQVFVRVERIRNGIKKLFWVLFVFIIVTIFLWILLDLMNIHEYYELLNEVSFWLSILWYGTFFYSITLLWDFLEIEPFLRLRARARFRIVMDTVSNGKEKEKEILKNLSLFREGVQIVNKLFRKRFDFVVRDPSRFYKHMKFMIHSDGFEAEKIKNELIKIVSELEKVKPNPSQIVKSLKEIISEPILRQQNMIDEVEFEPRLRKWVLKNLRVLTIIVEIISVVIVVLGFILKR